MTARNIKPQNDAANTFQSAIGQFRTPYDEASYRPLIGLELAKYKINRSLNEYKPYEFSQEPGYGHSWLRETTIVIYNISWDIYFRYDTLISGVLRPRYFSYPLCKSSTDTDSQQSLANMGATSHRRDLLDTCFIPTAAHRASSTGASRLWLLLLGCHTQHCSDVTIGAMASQITSLSIVYSTVYSGADQRKHQSSASLVFVRGIHRSPVNFVREFIGHRTIPRTKGQ